MGVGDNFVIRDFRKSFPPHFEILFSSTHNGVHWEMTTNPHNSMLAIEGRLSCIRVLYLGFGNESRGYVSE